MDRRDALSRVGLARSAAGVGLGGFATEADAEDVRGRVNTRSEPSQLRRSPTCAWWASAGIGSSASTPTRASTATARSATGRAPPTRSCSRAGSSARTPVTWTRSSASSSSSASTAAGRRRGGDRDGLLGPRREGLGRPRWQMLGGKFRDRIRVYADTPAVPRPGEMGKRLKAAHGAGLHLPEDGRERQPAEGRPGRPDVPEGTGRRPLRPVLAQHLRPAPTPLHRHPHHRERAQGPAGVRGDGPRDRRLGDPDRHRPLRTLRHRGRHQAGPGPRPLQPRLARGHGALAVHGPVRPAEELLQDADPDRRGHLPQGGLRRTCSRRRRSRSATPTSPPRAACSRRRRSATSRWSTGSAWRCTWPAARSRCSRASTARRPPRTSSSWSTTTSTTPWYDELVTGVPKPLMDKDGFIPVPDGPGLGIELNEDAIKALAQGPREGVLRADAGVERGARVGPAVEPCATGPGARSGT